MFYIESGGFDSITTMDGYSLGHRVHQKRFGTVVSFLLEAWMGLDTDLEQGRAWNRCTRARRYVYASN